MRFLIVTMIFSSFALGCVSFHVQRNEETPNSFTKKTEQRLSSFVWGFVPARRQFAEDLCPGSRIETMELGMRSSDVWIALGTFGIYVPQHLEVTCTAQY